MAAAAILRKFLIPFLPLFHPWRAVLLACFFILSRERRPPSQESRRSQPHLSGIETCGPGRSMNAGDGPVSHALDFVLHLQFPTLQLGNFRIVSGWMGERVTDFVFERSMPCLEFNKRSLH